MNSIKNELLPFDISIPILHESDYDFFTSFFNHPINITIKYFLLQDDGYPDDLDNQNTLDIFGSVWWSSKPYSTSNNKATLTSTLQNNQYKILRHLKCNGVFYCNNNDCTIITPAPTTKINLLKDYTCDCNAVMIYQPCQYKAAFWMLKANDKLYGAVKISGYPHSHLINTFCKNHLNSKDYKLLQTLITQNPFKSTREILNMSYDKYGKTLMANPQMSNCDKITVVKKGILKSIYQDSFNAISLYQKETGHLLKIIPESTSTGYADITYQSNDMRQLFNMGKRIC